MHDFVGDIADKQTLIDFASKVLLENPDGIHCLINNACLMHGGILDGCEYEDFLYIQQVGVVAPFMLSKLFKDHFCGVGSIVNLSSTRAFQSQPNTESYSAAKGGITALTHAMAVSLTGVARVNAIAPGFFIGDQNRAVLINPDGSLTDRSMKVLANTPMKRFGDITELNGAVQFLCSPAASFITGVVLPVDGGFNMFSGV